MALYQRGQELVLLQDDEQIAERALEIAAQMLGFRDSGFWLAGPGGRAWRLAARRGRFQGGGDWNPDDESGIVAAAAQRGGPRYVPGGRQAPRSASAPLPKLALPVWFGDRVLGVLGLESDRPDPFDETERELLAILADQAALALENARLHAEQRRQVEEALIFNELAGRISASLDLAVTLDAIVAAAAELIPCALAEVSLWDAASQTLTLQAIRCEPDRTYPLGQSFPAGEGYTGWVVHQRQPLLVPDVEARQDIHPHLLPGERPFKAYAGVPLLAQDSLLGTLVLVADQAGAFGPADLRLLQALAHQAAIAIRNARLYQQEARRRRELSALYAVAEAVNRPGDLDQILAEGLGQAIVVLGLDMASRRSERWRPPAGWRPISRPTPLCRSRPRRRRPICARKGFCSWSGRTWTAFTSLLKRWTPGCGPCGNKRRIKKPWLDRRWSGVS